MRRKSRKRVNMMIHKPRTIQIMRIDNSQRKVHRYNSIPCQIVFSVGDVSYYMLYIYIYICPVSFHKLSLSSQAFESGQANKLTALIKPVFLTVVISALVVCQIREPKVVQLLKQALRYTTVFVEE